MDIVSDKKKVFSGNLFDRFSGLDFLLSQCVGCTVLDIASCDGLISYEFAKNGATTIHGIELEEKRIEFSRQLFRQTPVQSCFIQADLTHGIRKYNTVLFEEYDIVLFLGIYHHLKKQMSGVDLKSGIERFLAKTGTWFAVRTKPDLFFEIERIILSESFEIAYENFECDSVGMLRIYRRFA